MDKIFLEEYSLFRKFTIKVPLTMHRIQKPAINMHCNKCLSTQTFNMVNEYYEFYDRINAPASNNQTVRLLYLCEACKSTFRQFHVYISPGLDYVYKFGQYPEWEIKIDRNLEKALGNHAKNFKKGLICESQGYGIGAFAYYRRITEEIIDELLDSIIGLIEVENQLKYMTALAETKKTRVAQEKINLVKDLLPGILRPNGMNPLSVLHSELSEGLHADTDEECLEKSSHIRDILTFLINQILSSKEASKQFTSSMRTLLDKKAQ